VNFTVVRCLGLIGALAIAKDLRDLLFDRPELRRRREMTDFYSQFVRRGELCFDIGANLGDRTEAFRRLGAKVVAVEPHPLCMRVLRAKFGSDRNVTLVEAAVGAETGQATCLVTDAHALSSLSTEWIGAVQASGRFAKHTWKPSLVVRLTTLDQLRQAHGHPVFCKIDVEGYELEVLKGLSRPIQAMSFEFTPEFGESGIATVRRVSQLGDPHFNFSIGESYRFSLADWVNADSICAYLARLPTPETFGDIYAQFAEASPKQRDNRQTSS